MKNSKFILFFLILAGSSLAFTYRLTHQRQSVFRIPVKKPVAEVFMEGDLIFQTSDSGQSKAVQLATHSKWSHCGIVMKYNNAWYVCEAVQPVRRIPLKDWISNGDDGIYALRRLKNRDQFLNDSIIGVMKTNFKRWEGRNYDIYFNWSDSELYCSELVHKLYLNATGLRIGETAPMQSFDLSSREVRLIMKQRYGNDLPLNEPMISPESICSSALLEVVH